MLHLSLALALAAEPDPLWRSSSTGITGLTGADRIDGAWAPAVELRGAGSWARVSSQSGIATGAWASVTGLPSTELGWLDSEGAWLDLTRGPAIAALSLHSGSLLWSPWAELAATGGVQRGPLQLSAGPVLRGQSTPGGLTQLTVFVGGSKWTLWGQVEGRAWAGPLPNSVDWLGTAALEQGPWTLSGGAGAWMNGSTDEAVWVAGLAPDTRGVRALLAAERELGPVEVRAELSLSKAWGLGEQQRLHAVLGASWGRRTRQPVADEPAAWHLVLHLPSADEVVLMGSFNGWQPIPLEPGEGGVWSLTLDLPPGRHELILLVDGVPLPIPGLPTQADGFGGENSLLIAK